MFSQAGASPCHAFVLQCNHNGCTQPANVSRRESPNGEPVSMSQQPRDPSTGIAGWRTAGAVVVAVIGVMIACASTFIAAVLIAGLVRNARFAPATFYGILYVAGMYITFILARDVVNTIRARLEDGTP